MKTQYISGEYEGDSKPHKSGGFANFIKRRKWLISSLFTVAILFSVLGLQFDYVVNNDNQTIGQGQLVIRIGTAEASGTVDYTCDGVQDDIQFQGALDALPANGGTIEILAGNYDLTNATTVTRALANVTIIGTGRGTYITCDGATAIFTAGGNNWTIRDLRTDAGGLDMGATTGWSWENVTVNADYYAYRTDDATTAADWYIPVGRGATYIVAASDAPAHVIAQADYVCDGTADNVEIQAAIAAVAASGTRGAISLHGTFEASAQINAVSDVDVLGNNSTINVTIAGVGYTIYFNNITNSIWQDLNVYRKGNIGNNSLQCCYITGDSTDETCVLYRCNFTMEVTSTFVGEGKLNGVFIGQYCSPSPTLIEVTATANQANCANTYLNDGFDVHILIQDQQTTPVLGTPQLISCKGIAGFGSLSSGFAVTEADGAYFENCKGYGGIGKDGWAINDCSPVLQTCLGVAGDNLLGGAPSGFWLWCGGSPVLLNCEGISSDDVASYSLQLSNATSPIINGGYFHPPQAGYQWYYDDANNGRFRPFAGEDYGIRSISLWVSVANVGVTMDIGTTPAGNEIASNVPIGVGGTSSFTWNSVSVTAGSYLYATPSAPINDNDVFIYYTAVYAIPTGRNCLINTVGMPRIENARFEGLTQDGYSIPVSISTTSATTKNWRFDGCTFESLCTTVGRVIYADAAVTNAPFYRCSFIGLLDNNFTSFAMGSNNIGGGLGSLSGTWTVPNTATSVVINHGLGWVPQAGDIAIGFSSPDNSTHCWVDTYTATQFTVHINAAASPATTTGWWKAIR